MVLYAYHVVLDILSILQVFANLVLIYQGALFVKMQLLVCSVIRAFILVPLLVKAVVLSVDVIRVFRRQCVLHVWEAIRSILGRSAMLRRFRELRKILILC